MKLLAVDSNSVLNRAFYGIKALSTKNGVYTNAIYGFLNIMFKIFDEVTPDAVAFAFDLKAPTFRHKRYDGYKATRKGMPEELAMQLPLIKEILMYMGYAIVECEGFEADDILGTLAAACEENGCECIIATGDRDSLQLVSDKVSVRLATTKMGRPQSDIYDTAAIEEKYGVTPKQLIDVKALMGDTSDNIPGVSGIGEKTALALISEFKTLDNVYENIESKSIKPAARTKLLADKDNAYLSRELAEICRTAPIERNIQAYLPKERDDAKLGKLLSELEMFKIAQKLNLDTSKQVNTDNDEKESSTAQPTKKYEVKSLDECCQIISALEKIDFMCEFDGDTPTKAAFYCADSVTCVSNSDAISLLKEILSSDAKKRTDNIKSVYRFALINGMECKNAAFDISLAGYVLNPNQSSYLPSLAAQEYNVADTFEEAADDVKALFPSDIWTLPELADKMSDKIKENDQEHLLTDIEIPLSEVLSSMELEGFEIDCEGLRKFGEMLDEGIADMQKSIYELAGEEFNVNSPKQLGEILFVKLGLPAGKKTKTGYSTNADVLEKLKNVHPIISQILEYRKLAKLKSTYVDGLLKVVAEDGRIHTRFNQLETRTGRISSLEPNLQNIPIRTELGSRLRAFFRAKSGCTLVDADYSQIELRVLAHIADDKNMIDAFLNDEDIHTNTAAQVFDLPPLYITPIMRSRAKAVNFGIVYGIGAYSLSQDIGVTVKEADRYIKNYLKTYSGVSRYMDDTIEFAKKNGYVTTMMHRRRYIPEINASNKVTQAFGKRVAMNTPIQGTAADIIKIAMIKVYNRLKAEKLKSKLILQVHDELIVEAVLDETEKVKQILTEEMCSAVKLKVELKADVSTGENWLAAK